MTNRGKLISEYIEREGINKSVLAKKILFGGKFRTYRTLLNKLAEPNLSIDDVLSFSKALNHDFLQDIPELKERSIQGIRVVGDPQGSYINVHSDYKDRYYLLLEEQNKTLKQERESYEGLVDAMKTLVELNKSCKALLEEMKTMMGGKFKKG